MRFRLQKKEAIARPNILGNHSFPVHTYRWKDIAMSDSIDALLKIMPDNTAYRIEDTRRACEAGWDSALTQEGARNDDDPVV